MKSLYCTLLGLGLVAMLTAPAAAQGRGRGFGGGNSLAALMANTSVQKELKLDDQQIEKAKELAQKNREEMTEKMQALPQDLEKADRRTKMMEISREMNASTLKAAGEFLKPEQVTRLKQISYQRQGLMAFNDPEVAKKLNLTDSQKSEIQEIARESRGGGGGFNRDATPEERKAAMAKRAEQQKEALAKVTAKLNDEQQKTWKELLGAPFEYRPDPRPNN